MKLNSAMIVGLGNPGPKYEMNRHNVGFLLLDEMAKRYGARFSVSKWKAELAETRVGSHKVFFCKPLTFMNRSGQAVEPIRAYYRIPCERILVIHDDLDMAPGRVKMILGGSGGGHNGIKSLIQHLGTQKFWRLKIGIGRPGQGEVHPDFPVEQYVLGNLSSAELHLLADRYDIFAEGIEHGLDGDWSQAMNLLNRLK